MKNSLIIFYIVVQEKVLKEFRESGCDSNLTKYEKDKLKQLLKLGEKGNGTSLNSE